MSEQKEKTSWQDTLSDWLISIIVAVVLAFGIRTFIVEPYLVSGPSMMPTLQDRERLIVNKFIYYTREPKRGEVIVFKYPSDTRRDFIKRVIAVGGDTVEIVDGHTIVNDKEVKEAFIKEPFHSNYRKTVIPEGHVFVMGDNRNRSLDSRDSSIGMVDQRYILGKAVFRLFPFQKIGLIE